MTDKNELSRIAEPVAWRSKKGDNDWCYFHGRMDPREVHDHGGTYEPLYTHPPQPARDAKRDQRMFIEGWRAAAEWANRWDLISDVDSPAWITRFDAAMAQESGE